MCAWVHVCITCAPRRVHKIVDDLWTAGAAVKEEARDKREGNPVDTPAMACVCMGMGMHLAEGHGCVGMRGHALGMHGHGHASGKRDAIEVVCGHAYAYAHGCVHARARA